jgi:hypothetical protein
MRFIGGLMIVASALLLGFFIPVLIPVVFVLGIGLVLGLAGVLLGTGMYWLWKKVRRGHV